MRFTTSDGLELAYNVLGDKGPLVVVTPGGQNGGAAKLDVATFLAGRGYRVLLHDRRGTGASDAGWDDGTRTDNELQAGPRTLTP